MIKTVLFDLGNVILPFDLTRLAARLGRYCPLSTPEIIERLWSAEIANEFETGRMSPTDYFLRVSDRCGFRGLTFDEFVPIFNEIFEEDHGVSDLITRLKRNYALGLISNTNAIHVPYVIANYAAVGHFERHWWSNEAGVRKPDPAIYRMALAHFDVRPEQAVFIDDLPANIASAEGLGMRAILYQGLDPLKAELAKLGVSY